VPRAFVIDDLSGHSVTVDNNAKCSDTPHAVETTSFTGTGGRRHPGQLPWRRLGGGERDDRLR